MKKLLVIAMTALFVTAVLTPAATAFGECAGKPHSTKTADEPAPKVDKA